MKNSMKCKVLFFSGLMLASLLWIHPAQTEAAEMPELSTEAAETAAEMSGLSEAETEAPAFDPNSLPEIADGTYILEEFDEGRLHYYELSRSDAPIGTPLLILLHGNTMEKGNMYESAKKFADMGYVLAVPDLAGNGEDITETPLNMYDIVSQSAQNITDILAMYADVEYVDSENFCLAGFSLGGFIALYYAAYSEMKPQCVLSFCGTPVWSSILDTLTGTVRQSGADVAIATEAEKEQVRDLVLQNSPDQNMEELLSVPILMVNGEEDPLVPADSIRGFEQTASEYPNQLEVVVMEGMGHGVPVDGPEVKEFLEEYLPVPEE